ncbi:hypothetical protein E2542_SST03278 [Spatholobus suberectus]|nr:hypothetical protein E2542_SST03278 [Spatholobus suberectus]
MSGLFFVIETIKTPSPCGLRQNPCFRSSFVANNENATTSHHQRNCGGTGMLELKARMVPVDDESCVEDLDVNVGCDCVAEPGK